MAPGSVQAVRSHSETVENSRMPVSTGIHGLTWLLSNKRRDVMGIRTVTHLHHLQSLGLDLLPKVAPYGRVLCD